MDPVTLVMAALAAGALQGVGETAGQAVKDAYVGLKTLVAGRLGGGDRVEVLLAEHELDPKGYEVPLKKRLAELALAGDQELLDAATALLKVADPEGSQTGKYQVAITGANAQVVVGDGNTVNMR